MEIIVQTPTPQLEISIGFYEKLGFQLLQKGDTNFVFGENLVIEVNSDRFSRAGLKIIQTNWEDFIQANKLDSIVTKTKSGYLLISPSGCPVYLESETLFTAGNNQPAKTTLGNFSGLSLETNQIEKSIAFWALFGFKQTAGNLEHGWVSLSNEAGFSIGLMKYNCCPHLFFNPSLSFFNGKENLEIITKIRDLNIEITEEISHFNPDGIVDNIIIRDPGGLGYFLFSD